MENVFVAIYVSNPSYNYVFPCILIWITGCVYYTFFNVNNIIKNTHPFFRIACWYAH